MMNITSAAADMLPLPSYTLTPRAPMLSFLPDGITALLPPLVLYWAVSLFWHAVDTLDLFPQYRLHTPVEVLQRNHVGRRAVVRDVLLQQAIQTAAGVALAWFDEPEMVGREAYDVAVWAGRIRRAARGVPALLAVVGVDSAGVSAKVAGFAPVLAGVLRGGATAPAFLAWELRLASLVYYIGVPALQFLAAILIVDSWQYFLHRAMHTNRWLYATFHSRHHRLYVPYAFGALYNHPFEGFLLDTAGAGLAYLVTGMTPRQGMLFFTGSTLKTIDDHCGYKLPWDPLQLLTSNNAAYHDIHHQSWGIKTNYAQPFFTFWDKLLGTMYDGDESEMQL
ncbi:hypothetical protein KEM52_002112, partial [Ascosphaera acerosa]